MKNSRRKFIKATSATVAGTIISPLIYANTVIPKAKPYPVCAFTKCLQFLDYDRLGETLAHIGFDGADLTVRKGGHVEPEKVKEDLPRAVKTLHKSGISVPMMVTGIIDPDNPLTEKILGAASEQGVGYYRMGYLKYDSSKSIMENLTTHKKAIDKLEKINRKFGIQACYQNHSGTRIGGPVWDLYWLMDGCDPDYISVQYDICHAVSEGGLSWPLAMDLLSPWIKTTAIKDFYWNKENGEWRIKIVSLSKGMVNFDAYLQKYTSLEISCPVTIHCEYDLGGAESGSKNPTMSIKEISNYMKNDLNWLENKFSEYGIF